MSNFKSMCSEWQGVLTLIGLGVGTPAMIFVLMTELATFQVALQAMLVTFGR